MKISKLYIASILGLASAGIGFTGCSDDLSVAAPEAGVTEGIVLRIPNIEAAAEFPQSRAASAAVGAEGGISDLWLIVFRQNGANWTKVSCEDLSNVNPSKKVGSSYTAYTDYKLDLEAGNYKFYLLGNLLSYLPQNYSYANSINSENDIRDLKLSFNAPLVAGNLPMACLSAVKTSEGAVAADGSSIAISSTDQNQGKVIYADLHFLCSKVRYTVLFDKSANGSASAFGDNVMNFKEVVPVSNIANTTVVGSALTSWNGAYLSEPKNVSLSARQYPDGNYPAADGSSNDLGGNKDNWSADRRAWQGVVYLPENTNTQNKTALQFSADCEAPDGSVLYQFNKSVSLMPAPEESNASSNTGIARAQMYDLTLKVKNFDYVEPDVIFDLNVQVADWTPQSVLADFVSTYLTLSTTKTSLTSTEPAVINFETDGRGLTTNCFSCVDNDGLTDLNNNPITEPVIVLSNLDLTNHTMTFIANPKINIANVKAKSNGEITGWATCYIQAGNIKKQLKVYYDLSPYFIVTPLSVKIQYDSNNAASNVKQFAYKTNLGGIKLCLDGSPQSNVLNLKAGYTQGYITLSSDDTNANEGIITVKANSNPGTTVSYMFDAYPLSMSDKFKEDLTVTVMPPYGDYYIYFRAINDYQAPINNYTSTAEFLGGDYSNFKYESTGDDQWIDWWDENDSSKDKTAFHFVYIYGQNGEKIGADDPVDDWLFTGGFYNTNMSSNTGADNKGWYVYKLDANAKAGNHSLEPGKTLMIFHNGKHDGYNLHRAPHHNDAGIPLFDFEDREGWVLYDPTMEPYFRVFDDKPHIEDVTYTVYTKNALTGWYKVYGIASHNTTYDKDYDKYTIWFNNLKSEKVNNTWYSTKILLKAPREDYSKGIKIKWNENSNEHVVLFGGKAFKNNTGYYDGSTWHEGSPL